MITAKSFAVGAHPTGPILTILADGGLVACNVKLDAALIWQLSRALKRALEAQARLEYREGRREI
jgi:hypothetical protein